MQRYRQETAEPPVAPPTSCPACKSTALTTTSKTVTASTYWRCTNCGEVWNAGRQQTSSSRQWPRYR